MASRSKRGGGLHCAVSARKDAEDIPVESCRGWFESCDYCDKRFGPWVEALDEGALEKAPQGPGLFMAALRTGKDQVEVVDLALDPSDVSKMAYKSLDRVRDHVADKKSKSTKAVVLCRWLTVKTHLAKEATSVCAHWANVGAKPKFCKSWPGEEVLRKTEDFCFSDTLQKWCHPRKEAVWRKPRPSPGKIVEVVEGCNWTAECEFCDATFGKWRRMDEVVREGGAPDAQGIYLVAVRCGATREVVEVVYDQNNICFPSIRMSLEIYAKSAKLALRSKKFTNKEAYFQVRWAEMDRKNGDSDNNCYLYAHFLNAGSNPMMNFRLPGEEVLDRHKRFVVRTHDRKWCFEVEELKEAKPNSRAKNKRIIAEELRSDLRDLHVEDHETT